LYRHGIGFFVARGPVESTEFAISDAYVSVIEYYVVDKTDGIPKKSLAQQPTDEAHRVGVVGLDQPDAVL
jgi:hypothetical protein